MKTKILLLSICFFMVISSVFIDRVLAVGTQLDLSKTKTSEMNNPLYEFEIDPNYSAYRKIKINVEQNFNSFQTENDNNRERQMKYLSAKFQLWYSEKPFKSISQAKLHSEVHVGVTQKLDASKNFSLYEKCISVNFPMNTNAKGQTVVDIKATKWSCEISGMIPNKDYWFTLVLVNKADHSPLYNGNHLTILTASTNASDQTPAPPNTTPITYFLSGLVFSICMMLIYLRRKDILSMRSGGRVAHIYIGPALIALSVLTFYPIGYGIWLAFTDANQTHLGLESWIGLDNFRTVFSSQGALRVTIFSVFWAFISVLCHVVFGLIFALLLNKDGLRGKVFYRTILLMPWAIPGYISILAWKGMLQTDGMINHMLLTDYDFLADVFSSRVSVIFVSVWLGIPFMMMSLSGALVAFSQDMFEAAKIDGVSKWNQFRYLTLPSLKGTLVPLSLLSFIFTFNSFNTIFLLTKGRPRVGFGEPGATDILITYVYDMAFNLGQYGLAAAWSFVIFIMLALFSWLYMKKTNATEAMS